MSADQSMKAALSWMRSLLRTFGSPGGVVSESRSRRSETKRVGRCPREPLAQVRRVIKMFNQADGAADDQPFARHLTATPFDLVNLQCTVPCPHSSAVDPATRQASNFTRNWRVGSVISHPHEGDDDPEGGHRPAYVPFCTGSTTRVRSSGESRRNATRGVRCVTSADQRTSGYAWTCPSFVS